MNTTDDPILERLRAVDPARHLDHAAAPETPAARRVLRQILEAARSSSPKVVRRYSRRGLVASVATAILMTAGVAAATGIFSPDPADVETILDAYEEAAMVHLPGWRPELATETVWCMYGPSEGVATYASEYPIDQPLTIERLIEECATGNDIARNKGSVPESFTLCRGTITGDTYRRRFADTGETVVAGDLASPRPGFPIVLAWETGCEGTQLETSFDVRLEPLASLDYINRARDVEIVLTALSLDRCLKRAEADELALAARRDLREEWLLVDVPLDVTSRCHQVRLDLEWGAVAVWGK